MTPPLLTVTFAVPGVAIKLAATVAVNWFALTNVVGSAVPFQFTTAPEAYPVPFTVRVKPALPAVTDEGLREVIAGPAVTVKVTTPVVPPKVVTVTRVGPIGALAAMLTDALIWVSPDTTTSVAFTLALDTLTDVGFTGHVGHSGGE